MEKQLSPPWLHPLLKRLLNPSQDLLSFFEAVVSQHDIVRLPALKPNYIVNDPEAIHHILLTNRENYTKKGTSYERIEQVVGKGLLTTSGEEWAARRQHYQPLFQGKNLLNYVPTIHKYTEKMLAKWEDKEEGNVDVTEEMLALIMNISAEAFLGIDVSKRSLDLLRMINILDHYAVRSITLWKWIPTLRNFRYQIAKKMVNHYILESLQLQSEIKEPLLQNLLIKDKTGKFILPDEEILGEIKNFFIASHETTGNTLGWVLYCLAKNPYVMIQVLDEIKQILGNTQPNFDNIEAFSYLDAVIDETVRLYPPIWIFTRRAIEQDILQQYRIPAGGIINIIPYLLHRHPKYWNQPNIFYPERFSQDTYKVRPKCAYIPFGFGPRVCIGRQFATLTIKIIVIMLLQRFDIQLPKKNYNIEPLPLITLKPRHNIKLKIKKK